ncbi:hypothetical protein BDR07DRAFT_1502771 [Suillus spraguei]|nr:hypothetical protein BDR07DRAFT_1502771 [Suillus spraguei]
MVGSGIKTSTLPSLIPSSAKKSTVINNNNFFSALPVEDASDADDGNFTGDDSGSSSESSSLGSDNDIQEITNVEASKHARVEEVDDEDSSSLQPSTSSALPRLSKQASKHNPIYYFYELVEMNSNGQADYIYS